MRSKIGSGFYWLLLGFGFAIMLSACGGAEETPPVAVIPGQVTVDTLSVIPSGSAPVQVQATIGGVISDNCTSVIGINALRQDNVFTLSPQTVVNDTGACAPVQINYSQSVSLDVLNLPAGLYTVNAGTQTGSFNLAVDNVAAVPPSDGVTTTDPAADAGGETQTETQPAADQVNQATNGLFSMTNIYFIALEDGGQNGPDAGCNDSVVPVVINLDPATSAVMTAAYNRLLSTKEQTVNNYFNPLFQSALTLDRINIVNGEALVYLTGTWSPPEGDCMEAQMRSQLRYTALQYSTVNRVTIWLNGELLDPSGLG